MHRPTCAHAGRIVAGGLPVARRTDPPTSHAAAESAKPSAGAIRAHVLEALRQAAREGLRGLTDEELVDLFGARGWPGTPSGIRTRRRELVDEEPPPLVADSGNTRPTRSGRSSIVWVARPTGPKEHR